MTTQGLEQQLLESRLRLAAILDASADAILVIDDRGLIQAFNAAAGRTFRCSEHEALGTDLERFVPARFVEAYRTDLEHWRRAELAGGRPGELSLSSGLAADGREFPCEAWAAPHTVGGRRQLVVFVRDITDRHRFEQTLRQQAEFETFLFNLSSTFIGLPEERVDAAMEGGLASVGDFLQMDRITLLELKADKSEMVTAYAWSASGVPHVATITQQAQPWWLRQVLCGEVSLTSCVDDLPSDATAEKEYLRGRGVTSAASIPLRVGGDIAGAITFITTRRRVSWDAALVGRLKAIGDILWNALKRRQAMQVLLESETRFRLIASTAPAIIYMVDANQQTTYVNQLWTTLSGLPQDDALGHSWMSAVHEDDIEHTRDTYAKAFARREPFQMEFRLRRHDGEFRWIFAQAVPRQNADQSFAGYIGSAIDVTERKEAEQLLSTWSQRLIEAQEQERTRVARELHDDICQQLALLVLNLEGVRQRITRSGNKPDQELGQAIDATAALVADVQSLSHRLHSSKLRMGLATAALASCREVAERSTLDVRFETEGDTAHVPEAVASCLYRVLQEALQNAVKHSGSRRVDVSLHGSATEVVLTVRDGGVGFQLDEALKGQRGLGLVSMKERLKLIAGDITIDSRPQQGTTVRACVPLAAAPPSAIARPGVTSFT